jgi:hypothetical protein
VHDPAADAEEARDEADDDAERRAEPDARAIAVRLPTPVDEQARRPRALLGDEPIANADEQPDPQPCLRDANDQV